MDTIPQFGELQGEYRDRPGAYAVIQNDLGEILTVYTKERYHLPGGGIDAGEDPEMALRREIKEETGFAIDTLEFIGKANQFLNSKSLGPINKLGSYFKGTNVRDTGIKAIDQDHEVRWIAPEDFLASNAHDFHKWGVKTATGLSPR